MARAALTALIAAVVLAAPAAAVATANPAVTNARADRGALTAYAAYLDAIVTGKQVTRAAEQTYAATTATNCKAALAPLATMTQEPAGAGAALFSIGKEIGADATLAFTLNAQTAFTRLATTLETLHWAASAQANTVKRFIAAEQAMLTLTPSQLCADAQLLASQASQTTITTPDATTTFLTTYESDSALANTRLTAFLKLLDGYETPADARVVNRVDFFAKQVQTFSTNVITIGENQLVKALGIPKLPATPQS